ncbi:MAG TPA: hypothetical protein VMS17_19990 [Gemmataceae bacterium]|nr:hypothetical protein [Gemmataceae bacterium]
MRRAAAAWLLGLLAAAPLSAPQALGQAVAPSASIDDLASPVPQPPPLPEAAAPPSDDLAKTDAPLWLAPWGVVGLRIIPDGPKVAPNGEEYHPNFSMDLDINWWIWRGERLYLFGDMRFWGEKPEFGVTNANDGFLGTSKRQFDLSGGAAWNYAGPWELRGFGYSMSNLNRGTNLVTPGGINDGGGLENRYYLSPEYADLGKPGFDVSRTSFLSFGYYPTKDMVGNDGQTFKPGLMLRAYLVQDLWDWPCYAFGDATFISERSIQPKLLLFDLGLAARPFRCCPQCEFRLGAESTADFQAADVLSLWYASIRYVF